MVDPPATAGRTIIIATHDAEFARVLAISLDRAKTSSETNSKTNPTTSSAS